MISQKSIETAILLIRIHNLENKDSKRKKVVITKAEEPVKSNWRTVFHWIQTTQTKQLKINL